MLSKIKYNEAKKKMKREQEWVKKEKRKPLTKIHEPRDENL